MSSPLSYTDLRVLSDHRGEMILSLTISLFFLNLTCSGSSDRDPVPHHAPAPLLLVYCAVAHIFPEHGIVILENSIS